MDDNFVGIIAILAVFGTITAIIVGPSWLKSRERREIQTTVRTAIDKGQPLPPEVIEALSKDITKNLPSRTKDIRRGIIWLAVGIGIAAFSLINDLGNGDWSDNVGDGMLAFAVIPATIGLAFLILSFFNKNRD
jgi:polyferredoxin